MKAYNLLTKKDKEFIVKSYYEFKNLTFKEIAVKLGVSERAFARVLKEENINTRLKNRYTLNEGYFSDIDTERKAYFLGLLCADGYVGDEHFNNISLSMKDKHIIYEFKDEIGFTGDIRIPVKNGGFESKSKLYCINFSSKKMCDDLRRLGVYTKKSLTFDSIPDIPKHLIRHFVRGYFDGDGSITVELPNGNSQINFLGTKEVLTFIQETLRPEKINKLQLNDLNKNSFSLTYGGKQLILQLLNKFYKNPIVYLDRKYEKVLKVYSRFKEQSLKLSEGELLETP